MESTVLYISANPGDPSMFWVGESGNYYRTKRKALKDEPKDRVNPDDYVINTSFFTRYRKTLLLAILTAVIASYVVYKIMKKKG